jgi:hypothetical protein
MSEMMRYNRVEYREIALSMPTFLTPYLKASGLVGTALVGETVSPGDVLYADPTAAEMLLADADAAGEAPAVGIALEAGSDGEYVMVLIAGYIHNTSYALTVNGAVYLSATPGDITQTAPGTPDDQILGIAIGATEFIFRPQLAKA